MKKWSAMSDHELVTLYEEGVDNAFDVLLERHKQYVFSYILFMVHSKQDADDIFQETFIRAVMAIREHRYQNKGKFSAWLIRIAHNLSVDHIRSDSSRMQNESDVDSNKIINNLRYSEACSEYQMIEQQEKEILCKMLSHLPASQQDVVRQRFYEEMSFREIAEQEGISINTALGRMRYAIINLKRIAQNTPLR